MSRLDDARTGLHAVLATVFEDTGFTSDRVHATPPQTVAAPTVWIEQHRGGRDDTGWLVTFPVQVVYDGADRAQVGGIDELVARVVDAAETVGVVTGWEPGPVDVGGPTLRGTVVDVAVEIPAFTLCPTSLALQGAAL